MYSFPSTSQTRQPESATLSPARAARGTGRRPWRRYGTHQGWRACSRSLYSAERERFIRWPCPIVCADELVECGLPIATASIRLDLTVLADLRVRDGANVCPVAVAAIPIDEPLQRCPYWQSRLPPESSVGLARVELQEGRLVRVVPGLELPCRCRAPECRDAFDNPADGLGVIRSGTEFNASANSCRLVQGSPRIPSSRRAARERVAKDG